MQSQLSIEIDQIADRVAAAVAEPLSPMPARPQHLYTIGRGSSLHAAVFIHRLMSDAGIPASTLPPSLLRPELRMQNCAVLAISQSGASPDLCQAVQICVDQSCPVLALVNMPGSAMERAASVTIAQCAGDERAVAATKSLMCSVVLGARLATHWGAPDFALSTLRAQIDAGRKNSIETLSTFFATDAPLLIVGSGTGVAIGAEIALKAQELLGRPAMAYSAAEVLHGPAGMVSEQYPVLALSVGPEQNIVRQCGQRLSGMGANVFSVDVAPRDDALAPLSVLPHIYRALEQACRQLLRSPDQPANLSKVTLTG